MRTLWLKTPVRAVWPALFATALTAGAALAQGNARRGEHLAESWCASCHVIGPQDTTGGTDAAPPFPAVAQDPKKDAAYLRRFFTSTHARMPQLNIGRRDMEDLIAYFRSLRQ